MRNQCFIAVGAIYVLILLNVACGELLAKEPKVAAASNSSDELVHRIKRFLIFNNGGLVKVKSLAGSVKFVQLISHTCTPVSPLECLRYLDSCAVWR